MWGCNQKKLAGMGQVDRESLHRHVGCSMVNPQPDPNEGKSGFTGDSGKILFQTNSRVILSLLNPDSTYIVNHLSPRCVGHTAATPKIMVDNPVRVGWNSFFGIDRPDFGGVVDQGDFTEQSNTRIHQEVTRIPHEASFSGPVSTSRPRVVPNAPGCRLRAPLLALEASLLENRTAARSAREARVARREQCRVPRLLLPVHLIGSD
ncbi:hypothetical protein B0H14DRAFT_2564566 [Mycena olivaceomarginata]|nr:hypothetical protein B0H14DRAFT_2564566 [Mycena olivaceomarginata]